MKKVEQIFPCLQVLGCVIAQAFFSRGASAISLKSRVFSAEIGVIACSPEEFCEYFFRVCLGTMKRSTKSPRKIRSKIRGKIWDENSKNSENFPFCSFSDLRDWRNLGNLA